MKTVIFRGPYDVAVEDRPMPEITQPTDAIIRIVRSCVCGSDLWCYRGLSPYTVGDGLGHECIGIVEQVGPSVASVHGGELVICPFSFSCGACANCRNGFESNCGAGGCFGGPDGLAAQAEYLRVPYADGTLVTVAESPTREHYPDELLAALTTLSDVMSTGFHAAVSAGVGQGDTVVVVGDGAVGLMGVLACDMRGAARIIALSGHEDRQRLAVSFGATDIVASRGSNAVRDVMALTDGVGADAVLECVGSKQSTETALAVARPGSTVARVGLPHGAELTAASTFFRNVGVRGGIAPAHRYAKDLIPAVMSGRIHPERVFTVTTGLANAPDAYRMMDQRTTVKALLKVSEI